MNIDIDIDIARRPLGGRNLRYALTTSLFDIGAQTVDELVTAVGRAGFAIAGRPSKTVSDALRGEVAGGRVVQLGRGRYGPGTMPRQTRDWRRARVRSLLEPRVQPPQA